MPTTYTYKTKEKNKDEENGKFFWKESKMYIYVHKTLTNFCRLTKHATKNQKKKHKKFPKMINIYSYIVK